MNTYELINPSDPITFKAEDDKIAFAVALLIGGGMTPAERYEEGRCVEIPAFLAFSKDPEERIFEYLGMGIKQFLEENKRQLKESFLSFSYGNLSRRADYDLAIESITDPDKLKVFKEKHEDKNRTSMNQYVLSAWKFAESIAS